MIEHRKGRPNNRDYDCPPRFSLAYIRTSVDLYLYLKGTIIVGQVLLDVIDPSWRAVNAIRLRK